MSEPNTPVATLRSTSSPANQGLAARLGAKARKYYEQARTASKDRDAARKEADELKARLADLEKAADGNASRKEAEALKAELRTIKHRSKFDELAKAHKVRPEAIDDLWERSGYKADSDEVDADKMTAAIKEQQTKRGYLFAADEGDRQQERNAQLPPIVRGPGSGQGGRQSGGHAPEGKLQVSKVQMRDPLFMKQNQKAIAAAQSAGNFELVD